MNFLRLPQFVSVVLAAAPFLVSRLSAESPDFLNFQHYEEPAFPFSLQTTSVSKGFATIAFVVDPEGKVSDAVTLEASHPAFGKAAIEAMKTWRIVPAGTDLPAHRETIQYIFTREHAITSLTQKEATKALFSPAGDDAKPVRLVNWTSLNPPPTRTTYVPPSYPPEAKVQGIQGSVTVTFVVDETGAVRVPTITKSSHSLLSTEVLRAVQQWRFEPPSFNGKPVNVQVEREFSFGPRT